MAEEVKQWQKQKRDEEPLEEQSKKCWAFLEHTEARIQKVRDEKVALDEALEKAKQKVIDSEAQITYLLEVAKEVGGEIEEVDQQIVDDKEAVRLARAEGQGGSQGGPKWSSGASQPSNPRHSAEVGVLDCEAQGTEH